MYLLIFTTIYCVITQLCNIGYGPAMGVYLVGFGLVKGYYSDALQDVFNLKQTKILFGKFGMKTLF